MSFFYKVFNLSHTLYKVAKYTNKYLRLAIFFPLSSELYGKLVEFDENWVSRTIGRLLIKSGELEFRTSIPSLLYEVPPPPLPLRL